MEDSKGGPATASAPLAAGAPNSAEPTPNQALAGRSPTAAGLAGKLAGELAGELAGDLAGELVIVLCTFPKPEDLGEIAFTLVGENLCACVNILHESLSIYRWKGEIVTNKEVLCLIKTTRARHAALVARLSELHPYDVPEIVTLPTSAVNEPYLRWVKEETAPLFAASDEGKQSSESSGAAGRQGLADREDLEDDQ